MTGPRKRRTSVRCSEPSEKRQGLTLVHFSAQLERIVWDRGGAYGLCSPC